MNPNSDPILAADYKLHLEIPQGQSGGATLIAVMISCLFSSEMKTGPDTALKSERDSEGYTYTPQIR